MIDGPKTRRSRRSIALDEDTVAALRDHRRRHSTVGITLDTYSHIVKDLVAAAHSDTLERNPLVPLTELAGECLR